MYCRKCGNKLRNNANFCSGCGITITDVLSTGNNSSDNNVVKSDEKSYWVEQKIESKASDKIILGIIAFTIIFSLILIGSINYFTRDYSDVNSDVEYVEQ